MKTKFQNIGTIWVLAIVLFACAAASSIALLGRMNVFLKDDSGAIPLIPETSVSDTVTADTTSAPVTAPPFVPETSGGTETVLPETDTPITPADTVAITTEGLSTAKPGFDVRDEQVVWSTNTPVDIFRTYYENGERVITVKSDNGDKVIAPGTENSYTFKLSNTGNVPLDYTVEVDAYFTPGDIHIPITGRLTRYDGKNIVGAGGEFVDVPTLDSATDTDTLGAGRYTYYTLDWLWPFESGDDELDTMLGNLATEQDLTFTIVIKTVATANEYGDNSGILPPQTGDGFDLALVGTVGVMAAVILLILAFAGRRYDKKRSF